MAPKTTTKRAAQVKQKPAAEKPAKKDKKGKTKVVRDSFTMPEDDYAKIAELKKVCLDAGIHVKKSELLRAGLHALGKLGISQLKRMISQIEQVKTGRPRKI